MKLREAVDAFDNWSMPWTFAPRVTAMLRDDPEEQAAFDAMMKEASTPEYWRAADLPFACKIAHGQTKGKFPDADDHVIALIVRAASYDWR